MGQAQKENKYDIMAFPFLYSILIYFEMYSWEKHFIKGIVNVPAVGQKIKIVVLHIM